MENLRKTRIVIIGTGAVGSTTAYTLLLRKRVDEIVLIDVNHEKAMGDALDMNHGLPFIGKVKVWAGSYEDCQAADIIIITAGVAQKAGETRTDLLKRNIAIFDTILGEIIKVKSQAIILIASNPVDIMSYFSLKRSKWPTAKMIGSGTLLDSARFRYLIGKHLHLDARSVHAHIIGEHGDSELPVWSLANLAGTKLTLTDQEKDVIFTDTKNAAYEIIEAKGATYYAIALALDRICTAILRDEGAILNVSTLLQDYHGISDVFLGVPCIIDRSGVREILNIDISEKEKEQLHLSANKLKELIREVEA